MVSDQMFNNWLIRKKENYEEGNNVSSDSLILDALNCFQSLKTEGKWKNTSQENDRIVALKTQIQEMNKIL